MKAGALLIRWLVVAAILTVSATYLYRHIPYAALGVDDANISLVYAKNLAAGHGCVYHPGGERVEGFSCPLWVLVAAAFFRFTARPEFPLLVFNIIAVSLALAGCVSLLDRIASERRGGRTIFSFASLVFLAWVCAGPAYACWTLVTLMETGLWSALLILATLLCLVQAAGLPFRGYRAALAAVAGLLVLCRPEGMLWSFSFVLLFGAITFLRDGLRRAFREVLPVALSCGGTTAALTVLRVAYFGYPLPNTYYAKVSPDRAYNLANGWEYFRGFLDFHSLLLPLLLLAACCALFLGIRFLLACRSRANFAALPGLLPATVAGALFVGVLIPVLEGGDHFGAFRFYQPIWPLIALPAVLLLARLERGLTSNAVRFVSMAVVVAAAWTAGRTPWKRLDRLGLDKEFVLAAEGREWGRALNRIFPADAPKPRVGAIAVGGIQYTYEGEIFDLMGLNNVAMAHSPGDRKGIKNHAAFSKDVFFQQKPEVVVPVVYGPDSGKTVETAPDDMRRFIHGKWVREPLRGMAEEPRFLDLYALALVQSKDNAVPSFMAAFFRKDYLEGLSRSEGCRVIPLNP
jgi:arabinofuranosyltransferase